MGDSSESYDFDSVMAEVKKKRESISKEEDEADVNVRGKSFATSNDDAHSAGQVGKRRRVVKADSNVAASPGGNNTPIADNSDDDVHHSCLFNGVRP